MTYPTSDLYDKCSIESQKYERASEENREFLKLLYDELELRNYDIDLYHQLREINGRIWDLESDIRKGKEGELGLEFSLISSNTRIGVGKSNEYSRKAYGFTNVKLTDPSNF